jgi:hypothetical protein
MPSFGPCDECAAMKNVPMMSPTAMAMIDQIRLPPSRKLVVPTASVAICALLMNHSGPMCQTLP